MTEKKPGALLLFDVDGVILDSFEYLYAAISRYLKQQKNVDLTREQFRSFFEGNPVEQLSTFAGFKTLDKLSAWFHAKSILFESYYESQVFAGMQDVLTQLAQRHTLAVVTSSPADLVMERFKQVGLYELFSAYLGPESAVHKDKKIRSACAQFKVQEQDAWFITDTLGDLIEAKRTNIKTIAVSWGYHPQALLASAQPDYVAETVDALQTFLTSNT